MVATAAGTAGVAGSLEVNGVSEWLGVKVGSPTLELVDCRRDAGDEIDDNDDVELRGAAINKFTYQGYILINMYLQCTMCV